MGTKLNITSTRHDEFSTKLELEGTEYLVQTEDLGVKTCKIETKIYFNGEIIHTETGDYVHLAGSPGLESRVKELMERQHKAAMDSFLKEKAKPEKSRASCAEEVARFLRKNDKQSALEAVKGTLGLFPSDLYFLSHYGYLIAAVEKRVKEGYRICDDALKALSRSQSLDKAFFYPIFYLNFGRTCILANRRMAAIAAFQDGLKYDRTNKELLSEMNLIGVRKPPVIPFLDRNNPINKQMGKLRHRLQNR